MCGGDNNNFTAADSGHCIARTGEVGTSSPQQPRVPGDQARCRPGLRSSSAAAGSRFQPSSSAGCTPSITRRGHTGRHVDGAAAAGRQQQRWGHSPVTQHSSQAWTRATCTNPAPGTSAAHGDMLHTPAILIAAAAILISLL